MTGEVILERLKAEAPALLLRFWLKAMAVFGSVAGRND
jgi:hypothetical protein